MFGAAIVAIVATIALAAARAVKAWRRAVLAQMAAEMWRVAEWRDDQRATALAQRMGAWARLPLVRRLIESEARLGVAG